MLEPLSAQQRQLQRPARGSCHKSAGAWHHSMRLSPCGRAGLRAFSSSLIRPCRTISSCSKTWLPVRLPLATSSKVSGAFAWQSWHCCSDFCSHHLDFLSSGKHVDTISHSCMMQKTSLDCVHVCVCVCVCVCACMQVCLCARLITCLVLYLRASIMLLG